MELAIVCLKIGGILLMVLSFIHIIFPKYFKWKEELAKLSLINRQMMIFHTFFIAFTVFLMGLLCTMCAAELVMTDLGKKLTLGLAIFWTVRLIVQFVGYSSELWKGKVFETFAHIGFSMFWIYLSVTFWWVALS